MASQFVAANETHTNSAFSQWPKHRFAYVFLAGSTGQNNRTELN